MSGTIDSRTRPRMPHPKAIVQAVAVGTWTLVLITIALLVRLGTRSPRIPAAMARRIWAPGVLRMLGARLRVEGLGRVDFSTPHLFAANHASFLDIPVLVGALPVDLRFLAKAELRSVPFLSRYIAAMGMVFIDRHDPDAARQSVEQVASVLEAGASLAAFPEGSRSRSGELQPVKTGAFIAAIKSEVPIVPVRILGSAAVLPPDSFSPRSGTVRVVVGDPIPSRGCGLEDRRRLAERVWRRVGELGGDPPERVGFH